MAGDRVVGNKFGVIGLLHFHKRFYCFMWLNFPFKNLSIYFHKDRFFVYDKKTESDDKKSTMLLLHKNSVLFYP